MAEVFAGHSLGDHGFQKPVAIKRLLPELASDQVFVARLIDEAKLLVGMQHGNIVSVLDLARDGDDVFLVMEFVDGPSLRQLLKSRGSRGLSLGTATYIVQSAAAGLEFAHARPGGAIIHADISPSNLLLTTSGEVRVADYGIARREGGGYGIVEGKWAYMAPEQARGEPLTPRSDVFALGVVLYELICGAHPFGRQVTHEERDSEPMRVIPPRVVKPSIPHGIDAICMKALAHDPRDRFARMQHLIDAIVEERFANQYREGASDLAQAIRECAPGAVVAAPRTMITDRPVTIMTRSLLRELTPARRSQMNLPDVEGTPAPSRSYPSQYADGPSESAPEAPRAFARSSSPAPQRGSAPSIPNTPQPRIPDSGANTNNMLAEEIRRAAAMMEIPPVFRADGANPMPAFRYNPQPQPTNEELSHVVGGHTMTGTAAGAGGLAGGEVEATGSRWTIGILAAAAVIGVIGAVMIKSSGGGKRADDVAQVAPGPTTTKTGESVAGVAPNLAGNVQGSEKPAVKPDESNGAKPETPAPPPENTTTTQESSAPPTPPTPPQTQDNAGGSAATPPTPTPPEKKPDAKKPLPPTPTPDKTTQTQQTPPDKTALHPDKDGGKDGKGWIRVRMNCWGHATINGQTIETMGGKFMLPPGTYTAKITRGPDCENPGQTFVRSVVLKANKTAQITIDAKEDDD